MDGFSARRVQPLVHRQHDPVAERILISAPLPRLQKLAGAVVSPSLLLGERRTLCMVNLLSPNPARATARPVTFRPPMWRRRPVHRAVLCWETAAMPRPETSASIGGTW